MYRPGAAARALTLALLLTTASRALEGQTSLRLGGGATMLADQSEWDAGTGWLVVADVLATVGSPHLQVGFEGFYGANSGGPWIGNAVDHRHANWSTTARPGWHGCGRRDPIGSRHTCRLVSA